jgi:GT2 family glycosyltransferase
MVVVVDDNSGPLEGRRIRGLCGDLGALYRRVPTPRNLRETLGRRSHARNLGTRCLNTDIVLYLDGDMLLGPKYVEEIKLYHAVFDRAYIRGQRRSISVAWQANGMEICLGAVAMKQLLTSVPSVGYIARPQGFSGEVVYGAAHCDRWDWCASNNLSVRRAYVAQIGYWDEEFLGWGEEDVDFSFRLHRLGLVPLILETDDAASYHLEHQVDRETNEVTLRDNGRYLIGKFPGIEEYRRDAYAIYGIDIENLSHTR